MRIKNTQTAVSSIRPRTLASLTIAAGIAAIQPPLTAHAADETEPVTLPEVTVEAETPTPAAEYIDLRYEEMPPFSDGGDYLRSLPGVSSSRMGGHGLEPVIRGQQQNRLNVVTDGAFQFGACPNRMDPPTSIANLQSFEELEVVRGYQTVTRGPGGPGGAVVMKRQSPVFAADQAYLGSASTGYNANGDMFNADVNVAADVGEGFARFESAYKDANNYEDGSGNDVRSAFEQRTASLGVGWRPDAASEIRFSHELDQTRDTLFAGAGMDSPETDTHTSRLSYERAYTGDMLRNISFSTYGSMTEHLMDNYSLRSYGAMTMETDSSSDTFGGRLAADFDVESIRVTGGADLQHNTRDAIRYRGTSPTNISTVHAYMWPDLAILQSGLFAEGVVPVAPSSNLTVGARYDYVNVDAGRADQTAAPTGAISRSPNDLYALYYGKRMENVTEHNLSGLVRYSVEIEDGLTTYAGLSRSVRTADASERAMAGDHGTASSRWVGNPDIDPEKHHQIEIGALAETRGWQLEGSLYHDWVSDFIFRDRARGQDGILLSDSATVYRNVDARLWGAEFSAGTHFGEYWSVTGNAAYTYGENEDTGVALPQIPPLNGMIDVAYERGDWLVGTRVNFALTQTRVDDDTSTGSGLDVRKTSGYMVPDLYASYYAFKPVELRAGISNLFDRTYANHLNRSNSFDTDQVQVNEPGRSFYVQARAAF